MAGLVFVRDAEGTPLMPMAPAYARRLVREGKAIRIAHHAFMIIQLTNTISTPVLQHITLLVTVHLHTAELMLLSRTQKGELPLLGLIADLRTDLNWRLRRRAGHRRRRRQRQRYHAAKRQGQAFALRRPSRAKSRFQGKLRGIRTDQKVRRPFHIPHTIRWRTQAIERVINALRLLAPISHVKITAPPLTYLQSHTPKSSSAIRDLLISLYGEAGLDGTRHAICAYCGTMERAVVVDHLLPQSRGGTDDWHNLVLACQPCNNRKGDRTPEEAEMPLLIAVIDRAEGVQRTQPYIHQTTRLLTTSLRRTDLQVLLAEPVNDRNTGVNAKHKPHQPIHNPVYIAKPIARSRKQIFNSRNYPLSTTSHSTFVRFSRTVKRRVRVNAALAIWLQEGRNMTRVIRHGELFPEGAQRVAIGMLCQGRRAGRSITGIVAAIHSTGRMTLLVPDFTTTKRVLWQRIVVSPQHHLRILSTDRVLFLSAHKSDDTPKK